MHVYVHPSVYQIYAQATHTHTTQEITAMPDAREYSPRTTSSSTLSIVRHRGTWRPVRACISKTDRHTALHTRRRPATHIRRNSPRHRRPKPMIEPSPPARGPRLPHAIPDASVRALFRGLELGLDGIGGKGDAPHGDACGGAGGDDGGDGEVGRVGGFEGVFDEFVGDKVAEGERADEGASEASG